MINLFIRCFSKNYFQFKGRASRKEYLSFLIFDNLLLFLMGFLINISSSNMVTITIAGVYKLISIFPSVSVTVRRAHDINLSAWWCFIDPNKSDIIFCSTKSDDGDIKTFRYTQDQKRKETKDKKYRNIRNMLKTTMKIDGKTPQEWETELSNYDCKTLVVDTFKAYLQKKNEVNAKLLPFYEGRIFRKLKWDAFMNRKGSEQNMINRFGSVFGNPKDVVIGFGDWEQRKQMKYKEPTKGKGMRELFRKAGYEVYLVDEFRTSCRCHKCEGECSTFRECVNPRPWKKNETILRHGLLMCKTCLGLWNRDVNSSLNIHMIVEHHANGKRRPEYLCRQIKSVAKHDDEMLVT